MTENSSYRGGPGQGRPGDDSYEDPYAHPQDDPHAAPAPRAGRPAGVRTDPRKSHRRAAPARVRRGSSNSRSSLVLLVLR